jgi:putative membrane protein insertion efficiency factor
MILTNFLTKLLNPIKSIELKLIRIYQNTLSLDHGYMGKLKPNVRNCKFVPTCSEYGYSAVERFGIFKGNILTLKRVLRCNPWSNPKRYDPVPEK